MFASVLLQDVVVGARFIWSLQSFLRRPLSLEEAKTTLRERFERREADFLDLARRAIYARPKGPYSQLLALAGCEYGDLEHLVTREGLEGALRHLYGQGVYLTSIELKGQRPAVRGSASISVEPWQLRNPGSAAHIVSQTSGSRGARSRVPIDLAAVRNDAVNSLLSDEAVGTTRWVRAGWGVPGGGGLMTLLRNSLYAGPRERWFLQVDPSAEGLHARYRWSIRIVRSSCALAGLRVPKPEHVPLSDPLPIVRWMAEVLRRGATPYLSTFVSPAVRVCEAAREAGIDISGGWFCVGGEPLTAARLATIESTGVRVRLRYGSTESGPVGYGCLAAQAPDDLHFLHDRVALIQAGTADGGAGLPASAVLISSLRPTARLHLLNVSLGDQAEVVERSCGCVLERLGWTTHLHTVRSFEKLTVGGMNLLDSDVIRVLEGILPGRFGGGALDYQLVEEEDENGRPYLRLLVHPDVGPVDAEDVADTFLKAIGGGSGSERVMELQWRQAGLLRVERETPRVGASGKVLHLSRRAQRDAAVSHDRAGAQMAVAG